MKFLGFIYDLAIWIYTTAIHLAFPLSRKARLWIRGRKNFEYKFDPAASDPRIWVHCASLGEFEQGRPLIEGLHSAYPNARILLSFFSPSGYEIRKDFPLADQVFYLPADTSKNASRLVDSIRPSLVIFVKYEFWYHYMVELHGRGIPVLMVSATFRENQVFFKWYASLYREILGLYTRIFLQDKKSFEILSMVNPVANMEIAGDTRFDRVVEISRQPPAPASAFPLGSFDQKLVIVAGSTWPKDEEILGHFMAGFTNEVPIGMVMAPHEVTERHLRRIESLFPGIRRLSRAGGENFPASANTLLVDSIGKLAGLYRYGSLAYIGGGFHQGIHNILEAAVYGIPVIFGPDYSKFNEASDLVRLGGAFSVKNEQDLEVVLFKLISDKSERLRAGKICRDYVLNGAGATRRIMEYIQGKRFLTRL